MFADLLVVLGRALIGVVFLWTAIDKLRHWDQTLLLLHKKKVQRPDIILPVLVVFRLVGGISVLLGLWMFVGAPLLIITKLCSIMGFGQFWKASASEKNAIKQVFLKDIAIIGALFILLAIGLGY